jgi:hypothetical protein
VKVYGLLPSAGAALALAACAATGANAGTLLFSDAFSNPATDLSEWTSYLGDTEIVAAPGGGDALTFTAANGGGSDLYTDSSFSSASAIYTLSFQIYGNCGSTEGCGFFVQDEGNRGSYGYFFLSDSTNYNEGVVFADPVDAWETVTFTYSDTDPTWLNIENWSGAYHGGYESFFIRDLTFSSEPSDTPLGLEITPVSSGTPEPVSWALMIIGAGAIGASLRSRRRASPRIELQG